MQEKICQVCEELVEWIWIDGDLFGERCGCGVIDYLDDVVYGADGWPVDMDENTKAWLRTNR